MNPEFDALIDRFLTTIPYRERMDALRTVVYHITDQVSMMNLYYATSRTMVKRQMLNVGADPTWNADERDVR